MYKKIKVTACWANGLAVRQKCSNDNLLSKYECLYSYIRMYVNVLARDLDMFQFDIGFGVVWSAL